jgi:hypothetical protein
MIATSGPVTRLKQSIADIDNESEEYNIAKGDDQRVWHGEIRCWAMGWKLSAVLYMYMD